MSLKTAILCISVLLCSAANLSCTRVFYQPDRNLYSLPQEQGYSVSEIPFRSKDGTLLYGWHLPAKKALLGTIILFHGNAQNISSHYLNLAWLTNEGYQLFVFDYRGYGRSSGEPTPLSVIDDGVAALEEAWKIHQNAKAGTFVVVGQSLGGAIAPRSLALFSQRKEVSLLVLDSTFVSYPEVASQLMQTIWLTWPMSPLAYLLVSNQASSKDALREWKQPLLVIHDRYDRVVSFKSGERVFEEAVNAKDKEFWELSRDRHISAFAADEPEMRKRFVNKLLSLTQK